MPFFKQKIAHISINTSHFLISRSDSCSKLQKIRVAMARGKQGICFLLFPDRGNTGNFVITQGKFWRHGENILTVINNTTCMLLLFLNFNLFYPCFPWHYS